MIIPFTPRRPLLSQEDNNDVVSNYFSKKQKGVGLLSVFNKVAPARLQTRPFFPPFQIKEFGDFIWTYSVFGVRLLYIVFNGYDWFTIASLLILDVLYRVEGGKVAFYFVQFEFIHFVNYSSNTLFILTWIFQVKDSVTPSKSQFKSYWPGHGSSLPPSALGTSYACSLSCSWAPLKKHFLIHSQLEAPLMWYSGRRTLMFCTWCNK